VLGEPGERRRVGGVNGVELHVRVGDRLLCPQECGQLRVIVDAERDVFVHGIHEAALKVIM
jgi:uncharacterized Zn-binding protein involved in type VI secretion